MSHLVGSKHLQTNLQLRGFWSHAPLLKHKPITLFPCDQLSLAKWTAVMPINFWFAPVWLRKHGTIIWQVLQVWHSELTVCYWSLFPSKAARIGCTKSSKFLAARLSAKAGGWPTPVLLQYRKAICSCRRTLTPLFMLTNWCSLPCRPTTGSW